MLDTSCAGSFMKKTIEFWWDLLERIKRNSEDWDLDEGKESGMTPKFERCFLLREAKNYIYNSDHNELDA